MVKRSYRRAEGLREGLMEEEGKEGDEGWRERPRGVENDEG